VIIWKPVTILPGINVERYDQIAPTAEGFQTTCYQLTENT